ncbi:MAG: hydrogen peroxide-inducible genes activator [Bacteroidota bacterium]
MTLQQLQYIIALDQHRHFVKAAKSCFVAQPTLTLQVKKLEEEINAQLFDRSKHPVEPTPLGEQFIAQAREILAGFDELKAMVSQERETVEGRYTVGIIPTLSPYLVPLFISEFSKRYPNTHLSIKEIQSNEIITGLKDHSLDIGILVTPIEEAGLRSINLFYEPFLIFASKNSRLSQKELITSKDITHEGLWLLTEGHCFRNQVLNICGKNLKQAQRGFSFESGTIETLKNMVRNKMGYTLIPELSVQSKIDQPFIRHFAEPKPVREVSIVVKNSFARERLIDILRKQILEVIPSHYKKNDRFRRIQWR